MALDEKIDELDKMNPLEQKAETREEMTKNTCTAENTENEEDIALETPKEEIVDKEAIKLQEEIDSYINQLKRLQADFENFRRRTRIEKMEISSLVTENILKEMLPLLDNFERALKTENTDNDNFRTGVEMIYKQFLSTLTKEGLEMISTAGAKFDPNFHEAVMRVQDENLADDTIAGELQRGYMVKGKVIRPSMVKVVSNS